MDGDEETTTPYDPSAGHHGRDPGVVMSAPIKWTRTGGYLHTVDGRFEVYPEYQGCRTIQGYYVRDTQRGDSWSADRVSDLKWDVEKRLEAERRASKEHT